MNCIAVREAMSARLDGERSAIGLELIGSHCRSCPECTEWQIRAEALHRQIRVTSALDVPNLTPAITEAISTIPLPVAAAQRMLTTCRILLACCAGLQLVATVPMLFGPIHLDHELGSWDLALSVGLLFAAVRPERAWGMLPLVGSLALALGVTAAIDISKAQANIAAEASHLMEIIGLLFLWNIARLVRQEQLSTPELRLA